MFWTRPPMAKARPEGVSRGWGLFGGKEEVWGEVGRLWEACGVDVNLGDGKGRAVASEGCMTERGEPQPMQARLRLRE